MNGSANKSEGNDNGGPTLVSYKVHPDDEKPCGPENYKLQETSDKKKEDKEEEKPKEEVNPVGVFEVFKFSSACDRVIIVIAILGSMANGAAMPLMILIFGDMIDLFTKSEYFLENLMAALLRFNVTTAANATVEAKLWALKNATPSFDVNELALGNGISDAMRTFALYYIGIAIAVLFLAYIQVTMWVIPAERQCNRIRNACFKSIMHQEIGWFDQQSSGELNNRLTDDINKIHTGLGDKLGQGFQWFTCCIICLILGFIKGWKLTLVILAVSPVMMVAGFVMTKLASSFTSMELKNYAKAGAIAEEVLGAIRTVYAFGGEEKEVKRYTANLKSARDAGIKKGFTSGLSMGIVFMVIFFAYGLGFWYGAKLVRDEAEYTSGRLIIVFFMVLIAAMAIGQAAPTFQVFGTGRGAARIVFDIIDRKSLIDSSSREGNSPGSVTGNIELQGIQFAYPNRADVIVMDGFSLSIPAGKTVALVGSSGCGKSTTVQLVQRFYDPLEGTVLLDGHDLRKLNVAWLRSHIGLVSQEPVLFACSIAENIRYGRDNVTDEEIVRACEMANARNFIEELPLKYDTLVGDRGTQLSGGQKQRVAIARALVKNPRILLLDEATSALDTESEAIVQEALEKASTGRTTIIVAHRLSTIRNADIIVGIEDGKVAEMGTHEELMAQGGIYATLVNNQTFKEEESDEEDSDDEIEKKLEKKFVRERTMSVGSHEDEAHARKISGFGRRKSSAGANTDADVEVAVTTKKSRFWQKKAKDPQEEELPPAPMGRLLTMNGSEWPFILLGCIGAAINGGVNPAFAVIFAEILRVLADPDTVEQEKQANFYALMFIVIGLACFFAQFCQSYCFSRSGEELTMRCRHFMFKAMLRQDVEYFDDPKNNLGALTTRLSTEASKIQGATGTQLGSMCQAVASLGTGVIIAFVYQWKLALAILAFVPFLMVGGFIEMTVMKGYANQNKEALEGAGQVAVEGIENIRTVVSLVREDTFIKHYHDELHGPHQTATRKAHLQGFAFGFSQCVMFFCYAATFMFGAYLIDNKEADMVKIFKVFGAMVFGAMAVGQASAFAPDAGKAKAAAAGMFQLLDRVPKIDSTSQEGKELVPEDTKGEVSGQHVHFRYVTRPKVPVLRGITFKASPGQSVALVGSSGCGKSTIIQLIERFYDPLEGAMFIDGEPQKESRLSSMRSCLGIVSQEPTLFAYSIQENIAYGDNSRIVRMDEIIDAARAANIHNFIETLPKGYDTEVGEKGAQLSGGQKQRIAIARALIRNPRILLLDEATSALDTESEKVVQDALDRAQKGRTSIVIAHRLSTIRNSHAILVLHAGKIREVGNHEELMREKGIYYKLVTRQSGNQ